jgi:hypothetical protein
MFKQKLLIFVFLIILVSTPTVNNSNSPFDPTINVRVPETSTFDDGTDLYAVIIGIADYPGLNNDQQFSNMDAYFLENQLLNEYHCDPNKVFFLHNNFATKNDIIGALDNVSSSIDANDKFLFYYSGKGMIDDPWSENFSINIETSHNYEDNSHLYWYINHTNVTGIRVHYSQFITEENVDFVQMGNISEVITSNYQEYYSGGMGGIGGMGGMGGMPGMM